MEYNLGSEFRMVGIDYENGKRPISIIGKDGLFQIVDAAQVVVDEEPIIIDMKARIDFRPDEKGDFVVNHLLNESKNNDIWGVIGLQYDPIGKDLKPEEKTTSYYQFLHPFAVRNRKFIEGVVLGQRMSLKVSLYQAPAEEAVDDETPTQKEMDEKSKVSKEEK